MPLADYFRQARPASHRRNLVKTLLQSVVFWTVFLVLLPLAMVWLEHWLGVPRFYFPGQLAVGGVLFLAAGVLNIATAVTMVVVGRGTPLPTDAPRRLVVVGPYRWIRNPMAVAGLAQGLAVAIGVGSWFTVLAVVAGGLLWNYLVRPVEEQHLRQAFGDEYGEYQAAVRCWLPRRWTPREGGAAQGQATVYNDQ